MSLTAGAFRSCLSFDDGFDAEMTQSMVVVGVSYQLTDRLSIGGGIGGVFDGELEARRITFDFNPGFVASINASYRLLSAPESPVSLTLGLAFAAGFTSTREVNTDIDVDYTAFDLRASATVSRTFFRHWTPYFSLRLFGGPVLWQFEGLDVTGQDPTHLQTALGSTINIGFGVSANVEVSFLGEQALFGGLSYNF